MDYARFVALRRAAWDELEARLEAARRRPKELGHADLEGLAIQYRRLLHDHATCSERFPGTGAARRLRLLALAGTRLLHRDREASGWSLRDLYLRRFPIAFRRQLAETGLAAALFSSLAIFGLLAAIMLPHLGTSLLGPERVADLARGHLWTESLTTTIPASVSSSMIATNNISVALLAWVGGALGGLGSLWICALNGFHLGSIFGVTVHYGMGGALLEFIAAHGPLELTLIMVAGGAGLAMARSMIVADDRPRREAVQEAARQAMTVVLGCLPWFVVLGLTEALVSPSPDLSPMLKLTVGIVLELAFLAIALNPSRLELPDAE